MRLSRTLSFYIVREVVQYSLLGLSAVTLVLVTRNLLRWLPELIDAGFQLAELILMLRLMGSMLVVYALPVSFLFGVLLAIGRMSSDVEITAMRACGIGMREITFPVLAIGVALSGCAWVLTTEIAPSAQRNFTMAVAGMLVRGASIAPGQFNRVGERVLYVDERPSPTELEGVVIADRSDPARPMLIFAKTGEMALDEENAVLTFRLSDGDIHMEPAIGEADRYRRIAFERFDYTVDVGLALSGPSAPRAREMSNEQLREVVANIERGEPGPLREDDPDSYAVHLHRRMATPLAPVLFALVGVPLGMRRSRGARSWGALLAIAVAFLYYAIESFAEFAATEGFLPPAPALWIPNLTFAVLATVLLRRARRAGF